MTLTGNHLSHGGQNHGQGITHNFLGLTDFPRGRYAVALRSRGFLLEK